MPLVLAERRTQLALCLSAGCMIKGSVVFLTPQEFLKKEFSEENILFWQACEFFSHVPETDKKQVHGVPVSLHLKQS